MRRSRRTARLPAVDRLPRLPAGRRHRPSRQALDARAGRQFFVEVNGSNPLEVASEVDRYCAWPGQACGYKVGHSEINRQRERAKAALGARFDLKAFNDTVVLGGNVPLDVLAKNVDDYIRQRPRGLGQISKVRRTKAAAPRPENSRSAL